MLNRYLFSTFILISVLIATDVMAQDHYRVFEAEYEYASVSKYDSIKENKVGLQEYEVNLAVPIQRENGDAIVMGIGFNNLKLFPNIQKNDRTQDTLYSGDYSFSRIRIQAGYSKKINENRSLVLMGFYRIAGDLESLQSSNFLYGGLLMMTRKKSEKFTLKYGLYVNSEYYGFLVIPVIGGDWKLNDKLRIYGVLPRRITVAYKVSDRFRTGVIFEAPNRTYGVSEGLVQKTSDGKNVNAYVHNVKNVLYAFGEFYLSKSIVFRGRVGYTIGREIGLYEVKDETTFITWGIEYGAKRTSISDVPAHRNFQDGLVLNASLEYRFSLE